MGATDKNKVSQKNIETLLPQVFYERYLKEIQGIHFTKRQIDIIACVLGGKKLKKIASFLSTATDPIVFKTVANHQHHIKLRLKDHGQNNLIDFLEKSPEFSLVRKYYSCLLIKANFEETIKEIAALIREQDISSCGVLQICLHNEETNFPSLQQEKNPIVLQLQNHFKAVGIDANLNFNHETKQVISSSCNNIASSKIIESVMTISPQINRKDLILLTPKKQINYGEIVLTGQENYYLLFFEMLKKVIPGTIFDKYILEFKQEYELLLDTTSRVVELESNTLTEKKISQSPNVRNSSQWKTAILIGCFSALFSGILILFHEYEKYVLQTSIERIQQNLKMKTSLINQINAGKPISWNLPRQDHIFVGRKELLNAISNKLHGTQTMVEATAQSLPIAVLSGLGGVGKTQLALQYAHHAVYPYKLKVWFSASNIDLLRQKYIEFAEMLGYLEDKKTLEGANFFVNNWLNEHSGTLLVFDDVSSYDEISPFLAEKSGTTILITSRNQLWPKKIQILPVHVMLEEESIQLVKKLSKTDDVSIKTLVETLGYLPLALAQASAYIAHNNITVDNYLRFFHKFQQDLLADPTLPQGTHHDTVSTTWNVSLKAIEEKSTNENVRKLARVFLTASSYFAAENIPVDALRVWLEKAYPNLNNLDLVVYPLLSELQDYSLLHLKKHEKTFSLHPLVQTVMRNQHLAAKLNSTYYPKLTPEWYGLLCDAINFEFDLKKKIVIDAQRQKNLIPHLKSLIEHYSNIWPNAKSIPALGRIFFNLGSAFLRLGAYNLSKPYYEKALKIQEEIYGENNLEVANTLTYLGDACKNLGGGKQAEIFLEGALSIFQQHYGKEHPQLVSTLANLGCAYGTQGKDQDAKQILLRALNIVEKDPNKDHLLLADVLMKLGDIYSSLGDGKRSKECLERSLKIKEDYYSKDHPELSLNMSLLGAAHCYLKDFKPAVEILEKTLKIQEAFYGKDHRNVAITLLYLGKAYNGIGNYEKAQELLESSLTFFEKTSGHGYYFSLALINLGSTYLNMKELKKANMMFEKALAVGQQFFNTDHPQIAITLLMKTKLHMSLKEFDAAMPLAEKSYQTLLQTYGAEHYYTQEALEAIKQCSYNRCDS